jgi:DNA polymerase-3 subunit epsilon
MINTASLDQTPLEQASFIVLDFETVTPKGRPAEPIELAAMRVGAGLKIDPSFEVNLLIKPPEGAPVTPFDTAQTGIRSSDVENAPDAQTALSQLEDLVQGDEFVFVAQNARYEAGILLRFADVCPYVASVPFIDTVRLGRYLVPDLSNYKLETLAEHFALPLPPDRHRALPDVRLTTLIFLNLMQVGRMMKSWGVVGHVRTVSEGKKRDSAQESLFE